MTQEIGRSLQNRAFLGIMLMVLGLALYPLSDAFLKHLMGTYSVLQTSFLRAATRLVPLLIAVFFQGGFRKVFSTNVPGRHFARLLVNLLYTLCFMCAIKMGSLTTVYVISYTSSFFMIVLSSFILKETVNRERWIAVALGMIGVIIAARPGVSIFELTAFFVLVGTFLGALNKILMRRLAATEHSLSITIYPNVMMILATAPFLITSWQPMPWQHWALFGFVGLITATGQYLIAQALRYAQGSTLAPIEYSTFFWVVLLDYAWWQNVVDFYTLIGAAVILGSNFYILYCTRRDEIRKKAIPNAT